eukprot:TRINITY_DN4571_c0_g1_i1.p1 TRINITY_DN4571_c0_g1~~TRINITY_DN4571_c0_g1_i1.p1  ORF type:complete len:105 (-),score=2.88 TRINITY_DN4571_c0_g1_i1:92-406(-)
MNLPSGELRSTQSEIDETKTEAAPVWRWQNESVNQMEKPIRSQVQLPRPSIRQEKRHNLSTSTSSCCIAGVTRKSQRFERFGTKNNRTSSVPYFRYPQRRDKDL